MANIAGLSDFKKGGEEEKKDSSNALYAGGASAKGGSGQAVLGGDGNSVEGIFNRAAGPQDAAGGEAANSVTITMYQDGFTIDDGPFRSLDDPENQPFLRDMARGVVPRELEEAAAAGGGGGGAAVDVRLVDKRAEAYAAPAAPAYVAFDGQGQSLGGGAPAAAGAVAGGAGGAAAAAGGPPTVDEGAPTTTLQIRTADGRRLRARLNLTHTIRHVMAIIKAEGAGETPYVLMEGFPPAQITNFDQTIEAAGLKGAQITQKLA